MTNTPKLQYLSVEGTKILVNKIKENTSAISSEATTTRAALVGKADKTYVDTELGKKANSSDVTSKLNEKIASSEKGKANGVATLGQDGLIPSSQLPSYVDDVIEGYYYNNNFYKDFNSIGITDIPAAVGNNQLVYQDNSSADKSKYKITFNNVITPESGKIYVCKPLDNNNITILKGNNYNNDSICYRYTGSGYVPISDVPEDVITNIESLSNQIKSLQHNARNLVNITWSFLKELRDNGKLIEGTQYRITDYQCTTVQEDTQSAGHQFDIIVTADSNNKLNEVARAIQHDGDKNLPDAILTTINGLITKIAYFANSKLEAWKIWYCLDNDTSRFAWADATNGKGVIYRMIDEWNNDCPYDFKNIQFKRYKITNANQSDLVGTYLGLKENNAESIEIDANDNIWCYTFTAQAAVKTGDNFVIPNNAPYIDGSLESPYRHMSDESSSTYHDNKIGSYLIIYDDYEVPTLCGKYYLPDNVFIGYFESTTNAAADDFCYAYCSYNITLDNNCHSNSFGNNCYSNSFGNDCSNNSFGNGCSYNSFGNGCYSNSFGNEFQRNSFGSDCTNNSFGNSCYSNSFGNGCFRNSFGNNCYYNSFGNGCFHNSFGNGCKYNSFGNNCDYNELRVNSSNNRLDAYYENNKFENGVQHVRFSGVGTVSSKVQNYHIKQGMTFTANAEHIITAKTGLNYELTVAKQSDGTVVEYCEADLLKANNTSGIV